MKRAPCPSPVSSAASVLEPVDDVGADPVEALPAVLGGQAGGRGLGHLGGTCGGLHGLMGRPPHLAAFAWLHGLDGFNGGDRLGLRRFTLILDHFGRPGSSPGPGGQEGHLGFVRVFLAHMWTVNLLSLTGVAQFPQVPHHLGEVVARLGRVGPAEVGFALKVAGVGPPRVLALAGTSAGDAQAGEVPGCGHQHGAGVLGLGAEADGLVPEAVVGLSVGRTNSGKEQQQRPYPRFHGDVCVCVSGEAEGVRDFISLRLTKTLLYR